MGPTTLPPATPSPGRSGLSLCLVACAAAGVGIAAGVLLAVCVAPRGNGAVTAASVAESLGLPPRLVDATATQAHDNFVIATGPIEDGVEALYFLDFLTGDLKAAVINERRPGFNAFFQYNVAADFAAAGAKNPKYLMVPGLARNIRSASGGGFQLGQSVLYVVETTTGRLCAYALPWSPSLHAGGKPQQGTFIPLAQTQLRTEFVRDQ